jgi:hypothetical protein
VIVVKADTKDAREQAEASFKKKAIQLVEGQNASAAYGSNGSS